MSTSQDQPGDAQEAREFELHAQQAPRGLVGEFLDFLLYNKKWWLTPIFLVLLVLGALVLLGGTGLSPFLYTVF